jgi:Universal stress protein family
MDRQLRQHRRPTGHHLGLCLALAYGLALVAVIVMGTHGRTGLRHILLGSVAETMVRTAPCPVFTVKAPVQRAS